MLLALLAIAGGCTVPVNWFGRKPPPPKTTPWENDTQAGAEAYKEGNLDEAERRLELARERAASGSGDQLAIAASLSNLSVVHRAQGDIPGAIELQKEALEIREKAQGPEHPDVAVTLNSLAALYAAQDDYASAESALKRALAIREKALGADNHYTAESLNNLALLYAAQGRYSDAEPLYQRALVIFEQHKDPRELATALENYAALLEETGRTAAAEEMDTRARAVRATDVRK